MPSYYLFVKIKCIHIKFICIYVYIYWKALYKNFKKYKLLTSNTFPSFKLAEKFKVLEKSDFLCIYMYTGIMYL